MNEYNITIEETVNDHFIIYADNEEEAVKIAINKYKNGEIVLEPGEVQKRYICMNGKRIEF